MSWRDAPVVEKSKWSDAPMVEDQPAQRGGPVDYLKRQAGLTGRAALEGVHDVAAPFTNAAGWLMNQPLKLAGADYRFPEQSQNFSNLLTEAGLPEPETRGERAGNVGGRFISSMGAGGPVTKLATRALGYPTAVPQRQPQVASMDDLKTQAGAAYKAAEDAGVVISKSSIGQVADDITKAADKLGFDEGLHPRVAAALKRFATDAGDDITFEKAEILRRVLKNASASIEPDERRIAQNLVDSFDDYIGRLGTSDVVSGDPARASASIRRARDLYTRFRKAETIEELMEKARTSAPNHSASGLENAVRTQFRQLANNPKRLRVFTQAEQQAIKRVARGGPIGNAMRMLGKLAPTGVISGGISGGAGYAMAGPAGALALPAGGYAARAGATASTMRNARQASELMRGAPAATAPMTTPTGAVRAGAPATGENWRHLAELLRGNNFNDYE